MTSGDQFEPSTKTVNSLAIVEAVANREGVPALQLQPPLYEAVDPDALDTLLTTERSVSQSPITIQFEYAGYRIIVDSDDEFRIE
ncbi:hypothetical protein BG842_19275 [Haladaptatus sp. W1]|uniref:HalOD1 output domain-containing protein n=1 Tax=Haladaptatus sp. W1 TaxID=1897478 RepID=UPI000849C70E|nr:HalOD1 output domain-containing protein [Haladaptatus sp. W1]ODR83567.1 hypothetical protein BG842_19275 [Haladaptatus sp. W1]